MSNTPGRVLRNPFVIGILGGLALAGSIRSGMVLESGLSGKTIFTAIYTLAFLIPLAQGALTVYLAPVTTRESWTYAVLMPLLTASVAFVTTFAAAAPAVIVVAFVSPLFVLGALLGGPAVRIGRWIRRTRPSA